MPSTPQPGTVVGSYNYPDGFQPTTAARWTADLYGWAKSYVADAILSGKPAYIPGFGVVDPTDVLAGGQLSPSLTSRLQVWANDDKTAANPSIIEIMGGVPRPTRQDSDFVLTPDAQKAINDKAKADQEFATTVAKLNAAASTGGAASPTYMGIRTTAGNTSGYSDNSPGQASPDAQLSATLRREELAYQKEKDALDRAMARSQVIAQLGQNPGDAVQREIFLRTGMEPVGRPVNMFSGQQGPGAMTFSQNMQNMANQGVFGQNPTLPTGTAPFVPYAGSAPAGYAFGTGEDAAYGSPVPSITDPQLSDAMYEADPRFQMLRMANIDPDRLRALQEWIVNTNPTQDEVVNKIGYFSPDRERNTMQRLWPYQTAVQGLSSDGPGYANGTEITPDGWTTAKSFITGDPQQPWKVNPERVELRVVDGQPQAKVTPIKGPQYTQIASMGHAGGPKYPWGTEGDTNYTPATSPYPTTGTNPATPGTDGSTPAAPAFDPTKQYMDKDGRIRSYSEQQLSGLSQSAWDSQQLDAQRKAGAAAALLKNSRFTAGITAEELTNLQNLAKAYDPWLFQRLVHRYRPTWDSGDMTKVFDPNIVGYPVLPPATRTHGGGLPGTTPPASGTPPYNQPVTTYWGNRSPGWGGTWTAPTPPPPIQQVNPTTPPTSTSASNWGAEGNTGGSAVGTNSQHTTRPAYAEGTDAFSLAPDIPYEQMTNEQRQAYNTAMAIKSGRSAGDASQSLFQDLPGYKPDPNLIPTTTYDGAETFGTVAQGDNTVAFGKSTYISTDPAKQKPVQFKADMEIPASTVDPAYLNRIRVMGKDGVWKTLGPNDTIQQGDTVFISDQAINGETGGGYVTSLTDGKQYTGATVKQVSKSQAQVTGSGTYVIPNQKDANGQEIKGTGATYTLQYGDYIITDPNDPTGNTKMPIRYNSVSKTWDPVPMQTVAITNEKEFMALPESTRAAILSNKPTYYNITTDPRYLNSNREETAGPGSADWFTNYMVGMGGFSPRPSTTRLPVTQEEFAKLPTAVKDALLNGTPMPEGYEQYAGLTGYTSADYGASNGVVAGRGVGNAWSNTPFGNSVTGAMTGPKQYEMYVPYDYTAYQNESSPPGPAMAGHHWEYVDPKSGNVTKKVR